MGMRTPLVCSVAVCVFISQVLTVRVERKPVINRLVQEKDNLEDELRLQSSDTELPADGDSTIMKSKGENVSEQLGGVSDAKLDEDDIYDLTVGDVIRDVLFTLREHPEIVKELIESERRKLMEKMSGLTDVKAESELEPESGQVSSPRGTTSAEDTALAFELPPEQMTSVPKHFENKVGHLEDSLSPVVTGRERVGGGIQTKNDQSVESNDPDVPLLHLLPKEGGQEDPMFEYERKQKTVSAHETYYDDVKGNGSYNKQRMEDPDQGADNSAKSEVNTKTKNIDNYNKLAYINRVPFFPAFFLSKQGNRQSDRMQSAPHALDTPAEIDETWKKYLGQSFTSETPDRADAQTGKLDMSAKLGIDESKDMQETTNSVSSSENLENKAASMNILDDKAEMELFSLLQKVASQQNGKMRRESVM